MSVIQITVNGEKRDVEGPLTIASLLECFKINPQAVVVERNLKIVPRGEIAREAVEDGDTIEIIRLVGGG